MTVFKSGTHLRGISYCLEINRTDIVEEDEQ